MFTHQYKESISFTCALLGISRQVYYRSQKSMFKRQRIATQVIGLVTNVRIEQPRIGTRKLYHILQSELRELGVGRDRLFAILKANKMLIKPKRNYIVTTNSYHRFKKHKNLIETIDINKPEQVWVADITYVGNKQNPMYLALITDAYSKKIVGYNLANTLATNQSIRALRLAIKGRKYPMQSLIHHSDRGLQYCSDNYQTILSKNGIDCSMTEQYDPYQNAIAERINGILKQEFLINTKHLDIVTMQKIVKQSIDIYNTKRPHISCKLLTPEQMHRQNKIKRKTYKKKISQQTIVC